MSKANSAAKVIRTAIKRVTKQWGKGAWSRKESDGNYYVCLEGALFGFCNKAQTKAQHEAHAKVLEVVRERGFRSIPDFNDLESTTQDEVVDVLKTALLRLELDKIEEDYIDPDEVESLLDNKVD